MAPKSISWEDMKRMWEQCEEMSGEPLPWDLAKQEEGCRHGGSIYNAAYHFLHSAEIAEGDKLLKEVVGNE